MSRKKNSPRRHNKLPVQPSDHNGRSSRRTKARRRRSKYSSREDKQSRSVMYMSQTVWNEIHEKIGKYPAERGGAFGGTPGEGIVTDFQYDRHANRSSATYSPSDRHLNRLLKLKWNPSGIRLMGFVHSHPLGVRWPSVGDIAYALRILDAIPDMERILLPIVMSEANSVAYELLGYSVERDGSVIQLDVDVVPDQQKASISVAQEEQPSCNKSRQTVKSVEMEDSSQPVTSSSDGDISVGNQTPTGINQTFIRVQAAYDLQRLSRCRVIFVGVGGAASFGEDLARAGVGEFILIDGDTVSETNLATQQVYRKDIGRHKVDCISERIQDINPIARVVTRQVMSDEIDDKEFERLALEPMAKNAPPPNVSLICGFTDSFEAQARVNRLALEFGIPSLSAQVYREGLAAEIVYTYPGVTPACQRCILSSRYRAFLDEGFKNTVTSDGTPIFATNRLNATKGFIAMAIFHHETGHPRWGGLLTQIGNRNLLQIRMDPDLATNLGLGVFDRVFDGGDSERILFDEVVWLPQEPECPENGYPPCPDCGGNGDLGQAIGTFDDTRVLRPSPISRLEPEIQ